MLPAISDNYEINLQDDIIIIFLQNYKTYLLIVEKI